MPRVIDAFTQFFDDNGDPLVNGFLAFKESGTNNTDKNTYADINETIANANPLQLDGAGRCPNVFGTGTYNVISYAEDANNPGNPGQQIQQFDPVNIAESEGQLSDWDSTTTYNLGDLVIASDGNYYRSLTNNNENQDPTVSAGQWEEIKVIGVWNVNVTYDSGDSVYGSDGVLYLSLTTSNIGNNPTTDTINWKSYMDNNSPEVIENVGFTATVATKALTFDLKTRNLIDPTSTDKVRVAFRSETLTTGDYDVIEAGATLDIVVPSGATLGFTAGETDYIYLYAVNNAGALELGVTGTALDSSTLDDSVLHTSVAIDATADSKSVLYTTVARTNVPVRLIGRIKIQTGAIAGEWDNAPTELYVGEPNPPLATPSQGASLALLDSGTETSVTDLTITGMSSSYVSYMLVFDNMQPATDAVNMQIRLGAGSIDSGASDYDTDCLGRTSGLAADTVDALGNNSTTVIFGSISARVGNAAGETGAGTINIYNPSDSGQKTMVESSYLFSDINGNHSKFLGSGHRTLAQADDRIQIFFSAGNIATMNWSFYGLRTS